MMPYTGNPEHGNIPEAWKSIIGELTSAASNAHIPYRVRMSLVIEVGKPAINDHIPEVRDSHEASQNQAEDATEEKDVRKNQVKLYKTRCTLVKRDRKLPARNGQLQNEIGTRYQFA